MSNVLTKTFPVLEDNVYPEMISGFWCVVMPFFEPIEKCRRSSRTVTNKVKAALGKLHSARKRYQTEDIRWCHVGTYKKEVILFDLGDLVDMSPDEDASAVTEEHMKVLKDSAA